MFPPHLVPKTLQEWSALVAILTAVCGLAAIVWQRVLMPRCVGPVLAHFARVEGMFHTIEGLKRDMETVKAAVGPNGGASLADSANRVEANVRQLDARQRMVIAQLSTPVFEANTKGLCVEANRAYLSLFGVGRDDVLGMEWVNLIHPDDRDRVLRQWQFAVRDQRSFRMEYRYITSDGAIVPADVEAQPVRDRHGAVLGWYGIVDART